MSGLNTTWTIPHDQAKKVEGTWYVRVPGSHNVSLFKMVCEDNHLAEGMDLRSLATNNGLITLRMIRNKAQASELGAEASTLFAADSGTPRKTQRSRGALNTQRRISQSMEIEVPVYGVIQVLKPVSANDALYVEYDEHTLSAVIQFLRESGFAPENSYRHLKHDGNKGIQRRRDGKFLVKRQHGKHKSQIVPTLEDALQLQMRAAPNGESNGEGDDDLAMEVENAPNGESNGEGDDDPPILQELEIHQKKREQPEKQINKTEKWSSQAMPLKTSMQKMSEPSRCWQCGI